MSAAATAPARPADPDDVAAGPGELPGGIGGGGEAV